MKALKFVAVVVLMLVTGTFISCDKEGNQEGDPGHISGMGNAGGKLQVIEPFVLPEGVSIVGEIRGFGDPNAAVKGDNSLLQKSMLKDDNNEYYTCGSGGQNIILHIELRNDNDEDIDYVFEGGCLFECQQEGCQHAICARRVAIRLRARMSRRCKLLLYCINLGKSGSSANLSYKILGVSESERIIKLINALQHKKININDYSTDNLEEYGGMCNHIQDIVWAITNGTGVSDEGWEYINTLPNVD